MRFTTGITISIAISNIGKLATAATAGITVTTLLGAFTLGYPCLGIYILCKRRQNAKSNAPTAI